MQNDIKKTVQDICKYFGNDRGRLMDIVSAVQAKFGHVSGEAMDIIAQCTGCHRVEVESVVTFYAFFSKRQKGKTVVRVCNDIIDDMRGGEAVAKAFSDALGLRFGETTADGQFTLEHTPCIGMCDQAPAVLVNDVVVTKLTPDKAKEIVAELKKNNDPKMLVKVVGDGNNAHDLVRAMVKNHIKKRGQVIFEKFENGAALSKAITLSPDQVIGEVKASGLRGRGGAGFSTGMKWDFTRKATGAKKFILCNADEGEPGTFKDRVLLTECADMIFEGMTIAGYAIGAETGILYLRGEYAYLKSYLEKVLSERRQKRLLGHNLLGQAGSRFDIRIQMGAGAYICGEESALISSCEGLRGDPKNRPPFPAQKGYQAQPTVVNNVETFCCVSRVMEKGADWFKKIGTAESAGTKLLSVSGDCEQAGVYEVTFGIKLRDFLVMCEARDVQAVQVGGPSGCLVGAADFDKTISFEGLATGGSIVVFNKTRDILHIVEKYMEFFCEESCGFCTPCRVGNVLLHQKIKDVIAGKATENDLTVMQELCDTVIGTSRCGLGTTSPNPVKYALKNFKHEFTRRLNKGGSVFLPTFDIKDALLDAEKIAGRKSEMF
jgi:[NiFe] hydrogenase diaphorase moiety large subunit